MKEIKLTDNELRLVIRAVNTKWHSAIDVALRKDAGDIGRTEANKLAENSLHLLKKLIAL